MRIPKLRLKKAQRKRVRRWLRFSPIVAALAGSAILIILTWPQPAVNAADTANMPADLRKSYSQTVRTVRTLEQRQRNQHNQVVSPADLENQLSGVQLDAASGHFAAAKSDLAILNAAIKNWNFELNWPPVPEGVAAGGGINLPILLYHYPPDNFEQQLTHLEQAGYTTVDLDQALAAMHGAPLPPKPVVITFDDGFASQMSAYEALARHHMKATFYIIDAGAASGWCIGAGRRYGDPVQPPRGCGDAYLDWNQVRMLDSSGLITIAGHTVDHSNLPSLSEADQRYEIIGGKQQLEAQLGHSVRHFAYPYGAYNAFTMQLAREAGYQTATTTEGGTFQPNDYEFALRRVRDALLLY